MPSTPGLALFAGPTTEYRQAVCDGPGPAGEPGIAVAVQSPQLRRHFATLQQARTGG